ncbi:MAG: Na/Pi cotransporter family protein [Bacteroidales bacterium]|jgi:phosphate:Na+ symporter|nr:Na/Pi cotransporter family protein [Bacteroidales bacterium]
MLLQILTLLGALGMFLFGMNMMSSGLQKASGNRLRKLLSSITSNRFRGVLTGFGITALIQSSSATTVMVVGFVNAGLLTLIQAVGVIMGANIGTTMTAWIITLLGFKADISIIAVPLMALGFILSMMKSEKRKNIGEFIIGFALLFLGLSFMKSSVPDLESSPEVLSFIRGWTNYGFGSVLLFLLIGTVLTLILQSSSATVALTMVMLTMGWMPFEYSAAMILGENIGTTITANIAATVGNTSAKRAALAHTVFNVFGVIWALTFFRPFVGFIGNIIELMGLPNPTTIGLDVTSEENQTALLYGLSMLHTVFNLITTLILVWFCPQIVKLVSAIIKMPKSTEEQEVFSLKYINVGPISTAELSIKQALKEVVHFGRISQKGLDYALRAVNSKTGNEFDIYRNKLVKYEEISDRMELEIANYLHKIPTADISASTSEKIRTLYKIIGELESLGDSGETIGNIIVRRNLHNKRFNEEELKSITNMFDKVNLAYDVMIDNLVSVADGKSVDLTSAHNVENQINELRNNLRDEEMYKMESKGDFLTSVYYLDLISELERMGDYIINVSQALV